MSNKKPQRERVAVLLGCRKFTLLVTLGLGHVYELRKVLDFCPCGRQYFWDTVRRRPTRLPFFGPSLAFIKGRWVQTTALCQSRTRHSVLGCKAFYCTPHIIMCHFFSPLLRELEHYLCPSLILILFQKSAIFHKYHFLGTTTQINIQKNFLTKPLTNHFLCIIFRIVRGHKDPKTSCESICGDQRFRLPPTFSLLWTLGPKI